MLSGRNALGSIEQTLAQLQQQIRISDDQIQQFSDEKMDLGLQQSQSFRDLARFRLDHILSSEVQTKLSSVDLRIRALLEKRQIALKELKEEISIARDQQAIIEDNRSLLADQRDELVASLDLHEAEMRQQLKKQESYLLQLEKVRATEQTAAQAEDKMHKAQQNRIDKGSSYEQDSLFLYLWGRGYGTSSYHANALIRFLDKQVANLCDYHDARPNYAMLLEIPLRLQAHAKTLRRIANQEADQLQELESLAAAQAGLPEQHDSLSVLQQEIIDTDREIIEKEETMHLMLNQKMAFSSGEDTYFGQAVETLAEALKTEDLDTLYQRARVTPNVQDDKIVNRLYEHDQKLVRLRNSLSQLKSMHARHLQRLTEMEKVRRDFKQARYDEPRSEFDNKGLLLMVLNEFIKGVASSDGVWDTISREHRTRPVDIGPPFGRGRAGSSPWGGGLGGRLGGTPGRGGSSKRRGGFRTGGGF